MHISKLFERENPELAELIHVIRTQCSEFLSNPTPLYRGTDIFSDAKLFVTEPIRTDRRPLSQRNAGTAFFNMAIEEELGIKNVRNRSAFATNDYMTARSYGDIWLAFPTNGSKVLFNPLLNDSIGIIRGITSNIMNGIESAYRKLSKEQQTAFMAKFRELDNHPIAPEGWFEDLLNNTSDDFYDAAINAYERVKHGELSHYEVTTPNNLPRTRTPLEFMIFDAPSIILVDPTALSSLPEIKEKGNGNAEKVWYSLIDLIQ